MQSVALPLHVAGFGLEAESLQFTHSTSCDAHSAVSGELGAGSQQTLTASLHARPRSRHFITLTAPRQLVAKQTSVKPPLCSWTFLDQAATMCSKEAVELPGVESMTLQMYPAAEPHLRWQLGTWKLLA